MNNTQANDIRIKIKKTLKAIKAIPNQGMKWKWNMTEEEEAAYDIQFKQQQEEIDAKWKEIDLLREDLKAIEPDAPEFQDAKAALIAAEKGHDNTYSYKGLKARLAEFGFTKRGWNNQDERGMGTVWFNNETTQQSIATQHSYVVVGYHYWYIDGE